MQENLTPGTVSAEEALSGVNMEEIQALALRGIQIRQAGEPLDPASAESFALIRQLRWRSAFPVGKNTNSDAPPNIRFNGDQPLQDLADRLSQI